MAEADSSSYYLLRWSDHISNYADMFITLREEEEFLDCSIACYDGVVGAHRVVLAGCSSYLRDLLKRTNNQNPVIFLLEVPRRTVLLLLEFIYRGQAHIPHNQLRQLVTLGKAMKIKGLSKIHLPDNYDPMLPHIPRLHGLPDVNYNDRPCEYPKPSPDITSPSPRVTEMTSPTVQKNLPVSPTKTPSFPQKDSANSDLSSPQKVSADSDPSFLQESSPDFDPNSPHEGSASSDDSDHESNAPETDDDNSQKEEAYKKTEEEKVKKYGTASESSIENIAKTQQQEEGIPELPNTPSSKSRSDESPKKPEVEKSVGKPSIKTTERPRNPDPSLSSPVSVSHRVDTSSSTSSSSNSVTKSNNTPKAKSKQTTSSDKKAKPPPTTQSKKRVRSDSPGVVKKKKKDTNGKGKPTANKKKKDVTASKKKKDVTASKKKKDVKGKTKAKAPVYKTKTSHKRYHKWWYTVKRNQLEMGAYAQKHGVEASLRYGEKKYGVQVREKSIQRMVSIYKDYLKNNKKQAKSAKKK